MKLIILFSSFCLFAFNSFSQTTAIPDINFEQALIDLGYDTGLPDGSVPTASIDTVTYLNVTYLGINDLTGIEDFVALEILFAAMNTLDSLNLSSNTELVQVSLSSCWLNYLDISGCANLEWLLLVWNNLTSLDVSQNTQLKTLITPYNANLGNIDVSNNPNLEVLDVSGCSVTALDVSQNNLLDILNCAENQITQLDVMNCTVLTTLRCQDNLITELNLSNQSQLEKLKCGINQLTCLNIKNGNNLNLIEFEAYDNPNLLCIETDDPVWATNNLLIVDGSVSFSSNCSNACSVVGIKEEVTEVQIFPNPVTNGTIFIQSVPINTFFQLATIAGEIIISDELNANTLSLSELPDGIYVLTIYYDTKVESFPIVLNKL